jgi:hypothetical protein
MSGVLQWVTEARCTLAGPEPAIAPGPQCTDTYDCPFQDHCGAGQPPGPEYPIQILPRLAGRRLQALEEAGVEDARDIPDEFELTARQEWVARVIKSGTPELDRGSALFLNDLPYPRYHLDFETISVAVPFWAGTSPYQKLPVQWSCHIEEAPNRLRHVAFLAEGPGDPRRPLTEALIAALGDTGPVFVYNQAFERSRLEELAQVFPDLAARVQSILGRVIDLLPIAKACYCHPAMRGSWSLKSVLPTIAPELAYDDLEVGGGDEAAAAWLEIFHPETPEDRRVALRAALARYCSLDTLATVRVASFLQGIAPPAEAEGASQARLAQAAGAVAPTASIP